MSPQSSFRFTQKGPIPLSLQYHMHPILSSLSTLPELDLQRWEWDFPFNLCDILIPSPNTCLILCENAKVISCLWGSAFWTPAPGLCLKQGPDPEDNYFGAYIGCESCRSEMQVLTWFTLTGIREMGSRSNKLWRLNSVIHHFLVEKRIKAIKHN